jgi:hypothetical protein
MHLPPVQTEGVDVVVSHALPHPAQLLMVVIGVSQPLMSGAVVLQLAKPARHEP